MKSVSVLMPVYNGAAYLAEAIESILNQKFIDFELLIINDASVDSSEDVIKKFTDERIRYYRNDLNLGLVSTLNRGIELAKSRYIARMDQDDRAYPERLQLQFEFLEQNPEYTIVGSHIRFMDSGDVLNYPLSNELIKTELLLRPAFAHPAVMIRTSALKDNNLQYSKNFQHAEDFGLWVQLSAYGKMANLDRVLLDYRRHLQQYSSEYKKAMHEAARKARHYYLSIIPSSLTAEEETVFLDLIESKTDSYTSKQYTIAGKLLEALHDRFEKCEFNKPVIVKTALSLWQKLCIKRQNRNVNSYRLFIGNKLSLKCSIRLHVWFIKKFLNSL